VQIPCLNRLKERRREVRKGTKLQEEKAGTTLRDSSIRRRNISLSEYTDVAIGPLWSVWQSVTIKVVGSQSCYVPTNCYTEGTWNPAYLTECWTQHQPISFCSYENESLLIIPSSELGEIEDALLNAPCLGSLQKEQKCPVQSSSVRFSPVSVTWLMSETWTEFHGNVNIVPLQVAPSSYHGYNSANTALERGCYTETVQTTHDSLNIKGTIGLYLKNK
jgi:hypothetical protein